MLLCFYGFSGNFAILFQANLENIIEPHNTNKNIFYKENRKTEKEKESNFTGRDADRPKGIGISPEGWLVRNEQDIMPKSFCQTE
jgi:hypothetical protein